MKPKDTIDAFRLDGKVSIVTGASRGIGRAAAEALAGAGSDVAIVGRVEKTLEAAAEEIASATGRRIVTVVGDASDPEFCKSMAERARSELGRLDVLFNNAGTNRRGDSLTFSEEEWDAVVDLNLKGAFFAAQACANVMKEQESGGKIINTLSLASSMGLAGVPAYSAAKGGLALLTKTLAVEWAPHGIQVNGIGPGFIRTAMNQEVQDDHRSNWIVRRTPVRRWGETHELCGAVVWLASSAADFVTGRAIYVDGGFLSGSDWRTGD